MGRQHHRISALDDAIVPALVRAQGQLGDLMQRDAQPVSCVITSYSIHYTKLYDKLTCSLSLNSGQPAERIRSELLDHVLAPISRQLTIRAADCCASADSYNFV